MLTAINFHYIHEEDRYPYPAIYPVTPEGFRAQLQTLGQALALVSGMDLLEALDARRPLPEHAGIITFDDGLRCQYDQALPVLDELGIPALFFVSAQPLMESRALSVHKIHYVRAMMAPGDLLAEFRRFVQDNGLMFDMGADAEQAKATYRYDETENALIKYYLNFRLAPEIRDRFIDGMFGRLVSDEAAWCRETYIGVDGWQELARRHYLGSHTARHLPLALLNAEELHTEISENQDVICQITGATTPFISYPYGSLNAVSRDVAVQAEKAGHRIGFSMERAINLSIDDPLLLARMDCNDALGGKKALMSFDGGLLHCIAPLTAGRSRYWNETAEPCSSAAKTG